MAKPAAVTIQLELTAEQVKKMMQHYGLTEREVNQAMEELVTFAKRDPLHFCEQNGVFNF